MYRALLLITALLLCACATEWHIRRNDNGKTALCLQSVRNSTLPEHGLTFIRPSDLRAGDILFSSEGSIRSLGIRVFSNAAVSHSFIYLGDGKIAEAVGSGTRIRALDEALQETNLTVAFRRPDLTAENIQAIIAFAEEKNGSGYNHLGIALQAPFSIARNACELPVIPRAMRHLCLNALATITVPSLGSKRLFCSQLVIEAFNRAGKPLTTVQPQWVDPSDILHMREDDIATIAPVAKLQYIGHLQCTPSIWNLSCQTRPALHPPSSASPPNPDFQAADAN